MKREMLKTVIATILLLAVASGITEGGNKMGNSDTTYVRPAAVAGAFYPGSPSELAKMIAKQFSEAKKPAITGRPVAIISPHAGYVYSGSIAAKGYKILEGESFNTVIVISPSHTAYFKGVSAFPGQAYTTPLGEISIDHKLTEEIAAKSSLISLSMEGHQAGGMRSEHALEVQLPFLQTTLGKFELVALVMGEQDYNTCEALGKAISEVIATRDDVLIVASSDLSHFHDSKTAKILDSAVIKNVENFDYKGLADDLAAQKTEACGGGPIIAAMIAARELGASGVEITGYGDSGDVTGDKSNVVGYLSVILYKSDDANVYELDESEEENQEFQENPATGAEFGLTADDKKILLHIARKSIETKLSGGELTYPEDMSSTLSMNLGAFVTLNKDGLLRGCIGTFRADEPLYMVIASMARQAAFSDPRFPPVSDEEIKLLDIEISVLTPMKRIDDPETVQVGRDGLYMRSGFQSGVLLPQVPVEHNWDRKTFLEQTCRKAGLNPDAWKEEQTEIYTFQADIFGEE